MGWRNDVRNGYVTTLEAFQSGHTTILDRVYRARPESLADTRSVFVGGITEPIDLDAGTWRRQVDVEIVAAVHLADNAESTDAVDDLADELIDWLAANDRAHALGSHTEQHPTRSSSAELQEGGVFIPAVIITCRATIQQGRT